MTVDLRLGDCLDVLQSIPAQSVDAAITDPPYPEIDRPYGRLTEAEWWELMMGVCRETRRVLKPSGSAVFILQPNSRKVGSMRGWLFEFQAWVCREWNMVQDVWWWNYTSIPSGGATTRGLTRASIKACVWAGSETCHRDQNAVLWRESDFTTARRLATRAGKISRSTGKGPSGHNPDRRDIYDASERRGGVTPFNVLLMNNANPYTGAGGSGHGAGTPLELAKWWTRYICPTGGVVLDPFIGSGTMGISALAYGNSIIGIERDPAYFAIAQRRIAEAEAQPALFQVAS